MRRDVQIHCELLCSQSMLYNNGLTLCTVSLEQILMQLPSVTLRKQCMNNLPDPLAQIRGSSQY